ncbi:NF-kappa-B inhibitor-interacting Ras-like protein [Onthophagus taurus]|uniref:NF-kappa-B inhibitor-interacting Ras-like protein n=1 Tax=Onthophagus taurus TaxID=166361 RepID=UPI000C20EEFB|nr:NF-kappa-B inhibitor-interacting Ras-like protein [Onthophagus taurus]
MGKTSKVVVCGMKGVGKTSILEQVIYGNVSPSTEFYPTIEDIYVANIESDRGTREKVRFYDTAGIQYSQTSTANGTTSHQLPRHYLSLADGYILIYDTDKPESLDVLVGLKKDIDKNKDKKEVTIIVVGNKTKECENNFESTLNKASNWSNREKVRHFTASAMQRASLYEAFIYITSKLNPPPSKSSFSQLSMVRKASSGKDSG